MYLLEKNRAIETIRCFYVWVEGCYFEGNHSVLVSGKEKSLENDQLVPDNEK